MKMIPIIVMTEPTKKKIEKDGKKPSKTVIKLKLTGPNPNVSDENPDERKTKTKKTKRTKELSTVKHSKDGGKQIVKKKSKKRKLKVDQKESNNMTAVDKKKEINDATKIQVSNGKLKRYAAI